MHYIQPYDASNNIMMVCIMHYIQPYDASNNIVTLLHNALYTVL